MTVIRRVFSVDIIPKYIQKVFNSAHDPQSSEELLWRRRAMRMTQDAIGHTNLSMKPTRHNEAVQYARRWFKGIYKGLEDPALDDDPRATFDAAGLNEFEGVKRAVLAVDPFLFPDKRDQL